MNSTINTETGVVILMRLQRVAHELSLETGHQEKGLMMTFARLLAGHMTACVGEKIARKSLEAAVTDGARFRRDLLAPNAGVSRGESQ